MMDKQSGKKESSKNPKEKIKKTGDAMMFIDKQNKYLKKKKDKLAAERKKKSNRLLYLEKKLLNQLLSSKEKKEMKQLKAELRKKEDTAKKNEE